MDKMLRIKENAHVSALREIFGDVMFLLMLYIQAKVLEHAIMEVIFIIYLHSVTDSFIVV